MIPQPECRPHLHVGVIGHRRLDQSEPAALQATVTRLFAILRHPAGNAADTSIEFRCVTNLAEGADLLLTEAARASGATLLCLLPFPRDVYARDFVDRKTRARFETVVGSAEAVVELDGSPGDPGAYLRAARLLLARSELIVAIWDNGPERGPGGTGQIVREARDARLPVVVIGAAPPHAAMLLSEQASGDVAADLTAWLHARAARLGRPA